ncbi:MAG: FAD-binding and (Fe-S)-binding domain-containing protein, partial [Candidatus Methanospirareceae archaeon]
MLLFYVDYLSPSTRNKGLYVGNTNDFNEPMGRYSRNKLSERAFLKDELVKIFGNRVCFNDIELRLYSSDISNPPGVVLSKIRNIPEAVVKPVDVEELEKLLKLCERESIPITPRGAGTSGYGGAIPVENGIVVDFSDMKKVIEIDEDGKTVTVETGVIWNELEDLLNSKGLSLRLYPSSAPSSTVGGWVANGGGVGIGSYGYGTFKDNIIECEIVTPKGVKRVSGKDIDIVFGFSGTTGLITKVKFKIKEFEELVPVLAAFDSFDNLVNCLTSLSKKKLPLWHVFFKNALSVELTTKAAERQKKRNPFHHEAGEGLKLPEKHLLLLVYPKRKEIRRELEGLVKENGGEILGDEYARIVWEERFWVMRLKALGPSLIASEVKIDTGKIGDLIETFRKKVGDFAIEGALLKGGDSALVIAFFLGDERRRSYTLSYSKSLMFLEEGKKLGGSVYAIGMYLVNEAETYFGEDLKRAYNFKKEVDEKGILNPGKIFPPKIDEKSPIKGLVRLINLGKLGGNLLLALEKFIARPRELEEGGLIDAFICARCGYCRVVCPRYENIRWEGASPRGQFLFLREYLSGKLKPDQRMLDLFFTCTTCERCNVACLTAIPILQKMDLEVRPMLFSKEEYVPPIPFRKTIENLAQHKNPAGNPHENRIKWLPEDVKYAERGEICYWAGCAASYTMKNMAENAMRILNQAGITPVYLGMEEWCCGAPAVLVGKFSEISDIIKHNIEEFKKRGVKTLITSCAGCWITLALYYPLAAEKLGIDYDIEVLHSSQIFEKLIKEGKIRFKEKVDLTVTYHDPCHIGRAGGIYDQPREVLKAIPGVKLVEMKNIREEANCCGRHVIRYPGLGVEVAQNRVKEALATGAKAIV